jgi:hypothetical protein
MTGPSRPAPVVRTFITDMPLAASQAGLALISRRSVRLSEVWRSLMAVRQPTELLAVQLDYWIGLADDYATALTAGLSELTAPAPCPKPDVRPRFEAGGNVQPFAPPAARSA